MFGKALKKPAAKPAKTGQEKPAKRSGLSEAELLRARERERKLLKKIDEALRRIDEGSYGYCEETGDAIGIPRLLARPTATLTIEAQARREQKQKLYGE